MVLLYGVISSIFIISKRGFDFYISSDALENEGQWKQRVVNQVNNEIAYILQPENIVRQFINGSQL